MKDQIGTFTYFASTLMHRAAGGFGGLNVASRPMIPVPYSKPAEEFTLVVNDYWKADHKVCEQWDLYSVFRTFIYCTFF